MRKSQLVAAFAVIIPFAAVAADSVQMTAGRWEEVSTVTGATLDGKTIPADSVPNGTKTKFSCISANQARDPANFFLKQDKKKHCQPSGTVSGGRIAMTATCETDKAGRMVISAQGTYQPDRYDIDATSTLEIKQLPFVMSFTSKGRYLGKCLGDETVD